MNQNTGGQFYLNGDFSHGLECFIKCIEAGTAKAARFDDFDTFQVFLNLAGRLQLHIHLFVKQMKLQLAPAQDDKECNRHRAENRQGHAPIKKCQTNTSQSNRDYIRNQRRDGTAEHGFHAAAIRHHVSGNIGQIFCVKEAHGELAKMLRDPKSGRAGLLIGSNIGFPIIVFRGQKHQNSRHQPPAEQFPQCGPRNCFSSKWL